MSIITISRGSFSRGREVAEKVANKLNYTAVSREIILEASEDFNIPEIKLIRAVHDAPSILERFTFGKERYLAQIESTLLDYLRKDNIVYHGLAGHFFVRDVPHVLKVRIIADLDDRLTTKMARERLSKEKALDELKKDDKARRQWSLKLYGVDTWDSGLYDLVLHIRKLTVDDAVDIICDTVQLKQFRSTPESRNRMADLAIAAMVKAAIVNEYPNVKVSAQAGDVTIHVRASETLKSKTVKDIEWMARQIPDVNKVRVNLVPTTLFDGHF